MHIPLLLIFFIMVPTLLFAATDEIYQVSEVTAVWDGTDAVLPSTPTADYDAVFGDDASLTYTLPASFSDFTFYRQPYSRITVDTNGNIWFSYSGSAYSFSLPSTGKGPVISAWNDDLSSYIAGGVFIRHKTNPERVVIEWQAETYTDEGNLLLNNFETVLSPNGKVRIDYRDFPATSAKDFGSGISKDDGAHYLSVTSAYGNAFSLAGRSFQFNDVSQGPANRLDVFFSGTGQGTVTSTPSGIACNTNCYSSFPTGTPITLHGEPSIYSLFTGWTNGVCSGTVDCLPALNTDSSVTAVFNLDTAHQVQVSGSSSGYYTSIQAAYDGVAADSTLKLRATEYHESLICNRQISVTLEGGYDSGYTTSMGNAVLNGSLTITNGKVTASSIVIR